MPDSSNKTSVLSFEWASSHIWTETIIYHYLQKDIKGKWNKYIVLKYIVKCL